MAAIPPATSNKDEAKSLRDAPLNKTTAPVPVPAQKSSTRIAFVFTPLYSFKVDKANINEIIKTFSGLIVKRISQNIEVTCLPYEQLDGHKDSYDLVVFVTISRSMLLESSSINVLDAQRVLELLKKVKRYTKDFPESNCFLVQVMEIKNPMSKPTLCFEGERTISWFPVYDKFCVLSYNKFAVPNDEDRFLGAPYNQRSLDKFATKLSEALLTPIEKKSAVEADMKAKATAAPAAIKAGDNGSADRKAAYEPEKKTSKDAASTAAIMSASTSPTPAAPANIAEVHDAALATGKASFSALLAQKNLPIIMFVWSNLYFSFLDSVEWTNVEEIAKEFSNLIAKRTKQANQFICVPYFVFAQFPKKSADVVVYITISRTSVLSNPEYSNPMPAQGTLELFNHIKWVLKVSSDDRSFLVQIKQISDPNAMPEITFNEETTIRNFPKYDKFKALRAAPASNLSDPNFHGENRFLAVKDPANITSLDAFATKLDKALTTRIDIKLDAEVKQVDEALALATITPKDYIRMATIPIPPSSRYAPKASDNGDAEKKALCEPDKKASADQTGPISTVATAPTAPSLLSDIPELNQTDVKISNDILGRGAFCYVYKGTWRGKPVAIKKPYREATTEYDPTKNLQNEMINMWRLNSPNTAQHTVQMMGYCINPFCLIMKVMPQTLHEWLQAKLRDIPIKIKVAYGMAKGLAYMHSKGIVHGDIKPSNLYIDDRKSAKDTPLIVKYGDFGSSIDLSKSDPNQSSAIQTMAPKEKDTARSQVGTPNYAAPEDLISIHSDSTKKSDVYSFGAVLFEMVSGKLPHDGLNPLQIAWRIVNRTQDLIPADCPPKLATVIEACRAWEPKSRPSADELVAYFAPDAETKYGSEANNFSTFIPRFRALTTKPFNTETLAKGDDVPRVAASQPTTAAINDDFDCLPLTNS